MKRFITILSAIVLTTTSSFADEGMWMLSHINDKTARTMQSLGLTLTPLQLYNPEGQSLKDAVVDLCDFCSGVVVSPDGLMLTNHHCGYEAIQKLSTPEDDILKNGFVAKRRSEERPAPGYFVRFLVRTDECTSQIISALDSISHANKDSISRAEIESQYTDSICTSWEEKFDKAHPGMECRIAPYYNGNAYYVSYYKVYRDVRLVFTATETLGKFGGDTDNWMWPRQTCDFSMFRIYADKDGNPAEYSKDNVPLHTPGYAPVSLDGYKAGDYCMTVGYPGSTSRYLSSWGIVERTDVQNQAIIDVRTAKQNVWKHWMDSDRAIAIKYSSKWAGSSNYWKNSIGMNKAVKDLDVVGQKEQIEANITNWYNGSDDLKNRFSGVLPALKQDYAQRSKPMRALWYFSEALRRGIELRAIASTVSMIPNNADSSDLANYRAELQGIYKDYEPKVDEETMGVMLQLYREKCPEYLPECYKDIDSLYAGDCKAYAKHIYETTSLANEANLDKILSDSTLREDDTAIKFYNQLAEKFTDIMTEARQASVDIDYNERMLTQAILEMQQERPHYSDANFTMRLSYGFIQDYTAAGNHYNYYTDAQSLLDKAAQQEKIEDYKLEPEIVSLLEKGNSGRYKDKTTDKMQLCFLSNNDITGGNSGSPMFDGRGHVIGLAFDGNWEAMAGDISFDPTLQRCIGVDIRYVLWVIDRWGKAKNLIKELTH